jgi:hypothetical protein
MRSENRPFATSELDQRGGSGGGGGGVKWSQEIANWNYEEIGITLEIGSCGGFDKSRQPKWFGNFPHIFSWSAGRLASNRETGRYLQNSVCVIFFCGFNRWCQWYTTCNTLLYLCLWLGFLLCLDGTLLVFFFCLCFIHPCGSHNFSVFYTTTHWGV